MPTILVIDDNPAVATALEMLFALHDIDVVHAESPEAGLRRLQRGDIDLVVQDMNFTADTTSGEEGRALFAAIRDGWPDLPIILLTAWTQLEHAVELVKAGAADYIGKPWDDAKLVAAARNLIELHELQRESLRQRRATRRRREELRARFDLCGFVFEDVRSEQLLAMACKVARSALPVLISGPNGSGKERVAEIVHANSAVAAGPFVAVNCGALPAELIESELFGAEAGAYTGATRTRIGKFEAADGGTLFLDEIGTLPLDGQTRLLRALETGRFTRLGGTREHAVRVRVVSATNADLRGMVEAGTFREDLYYRLDGITLELAPLRDRRDDILPLARHFLGDAKSLGEATERALLRHDWPGNVRELRHVIQRACVIAEGDQLQPRHLQLPESPASPDPPEPDADSIRDALARHRGVIAQAAAELGLSRQALYRRMDRHGIERG
ncbi:MAG: sigma-54 dependent transcriptional regulator [Pseudoxanthomonas suwonensis]|nr:sigma-54 dependent transcriptional regulator [Pseudoxanthomonas suwonensis]